MYIFRHVGYPENCCLFAHTQAPERVQKQRIFQKKNVDFFGKPCIILICMDTMNIRGSVGHDELAELRNHQKIVGMKQLKKALLRGLILGLIIVLVSFLGMGIIDFTVFAIIGLLVLILAGVMTIIHNQRGD